MIAPPRHIAKAGLDIRTIERLFSIPVWCAVADQSAHPHALHPAEERSLGKVSARRLAEFRAGRSVAREAMLRAGRKAAPLLRSPDGSPAWPTGLIGSISHCDEICVAVLAAQTDASSIGCDIERKAPISQGVAALFMSHEEGSRLAALSSGDIDLARLKAFAAKEAVLKCLLPIFKAPVDFLDIDLIPCSAGPSGEAFDAIFLGPGAWPSALQIRGRWADAESHILAGAIVSLSSELVKTART